MYYHLVLLIPLNVILIGLYMAARTKNDLKRVAIVQPAAVITSWVIVASRFFFPNADAGLLVVVLAGMAVAIVGDFLNLNMTDMKVVIRGFVIAVIAYMTYAVGLTILNGFQSVDIWVGTVLIIAYVALIRYLWPNFGDMRVPGLIYGLVMPFMFSRAVSTLFGARFPFFQAFFLSAGTLMLYVGDIEFGIHTFGKPLPKMYGPILYAGGQFLIALSVYFS